MDDNKVKELLTLQEEIKKMKEKEDALKAELIEAMSNEGLDKYSTNDGVASVTVTQKELIKYPDELALIKVLKDSGNTQFIKESIISTSLNNEIKKGQSLTESLKTLYTKTISKAISLKRLS